MTFDIDRALDGMAEILLALANERPPAQQCNSLYALGFHSLGVLEYWVGHLIAGRAV